MAGLGKAPADDQLGGTKAASAATDSSDATAPLTAPPIKKHDLESAWTFWFDNPNGKQKQSTWGTSLRPIYTFSTVEDFWW